MENVELEDSLLATRRKQKLEELNRRNQLLKQKTKNAKEEQAKGEIETEKIIFIRSAFQKIKNDLLVNLQELENCSVCDENAISKLDICYRKLDELEQCIASSKHVLKNFYLKNFQDQYKNLYDKCQNLDTMLRPKKKFGFSTKVVKKVSTETGNNKADDCSIIGKNYNDASDSFGFSNVKFEKMSMEAEQIFRKDIVLSVLDGCEVKLYGAPNTMYLNSLMNCKIFCGPAATSIYIENCQSCTFVLACQQLRIHSTEDCKFYVHITSRVIIEDSKEVHFAPYNWNYKNIKQHFEDSGLNFDQNNWNLIDDFNWLSADSKSPNWKFIDPSESVSSWDE